MIANDLLVYFMTEDVSKDGLELKQGYNLVQIVSDKDAWAESLLCRLEAEEEVRSQAGDYPESELTERIIEAQERCPEAQRYDVVENPGAKKLSISLGNPSAI
jgi:hypothetical protein